MGMKDNKEKTKERKLTEAEIRRAENFKVKEKAILEKGYERKDLTISIAKANFVGPLLILPIAIALAAGYYLRNGEFGISKLLHENIALYFIYLVLVIVTAIPLAVIHERIHGFCWSLSAENGSKDIEYGFIKEQLTPYCTCLSPLKKSAYIFGSLMPMTILGIILGIVSIFVGNICLFVIALPGIILRRLEQADKVVFVRGYERLNDLIGLRLVEPRQRDMRAVDLVDHGAGIL